MKIDLNKLNSEGLIEIDQDFKIDLNIFQNKDIVDLKNLHVRGNISYNASDNLEFNLELKGDMILRDSVTLDDIDYKLETKIEEEYDLSSDFLEEYYEKEQNTLDIIPILWENIVLEVPMRFTKVEDAQLSGVGWSLGTVNKKDEIDPRMAKLAQLLEERKE